MRWRSQDCLYRQMPASNKKEFGEYFEEIIVFFGTNRSWQSVCCGLAGASRYAAAYASISLHQ